MGMMDFVRSSYNFGPQFTDVELQTKDIEEGYSGTMTNFWIDPAGYLWYPDYTGTSTFEEIPKDDERYSDKHLFLNFEWISTGQRGKYKVHPITKYISVYPSGWTGELNEWPTLRLHLIQGKLQDYEDITGHRYD
jgi:hypothetical protein